MRLRITHRTQYSYDAPVPYALQRLRLVPADGPTQAVRSWDLTIDGAREELCFQDHFGNDTRLLSVEGTPHTIAIEVGGEVETRDKAGVVGPHRGFAPLWLFCRETSLTVAGDGVRALVASLPDGSELERLHGLMDAVGARVHYTPGTTDTQTGDGVSGALCQRLPDDGRHNSSGRQPCLGRGARSWTRLGGLRRGQRHFARRALCTGGDGMRLS